MLLLLLVILVVSVPAVKSVSAGTTTIYGQISCKYIFAVFGVLWITTLTLVITCWLLQRHPTPEYTYELDLEPSSSEMISLIGTIVCTVVLCGAERIPEFIVTDKELVTLVNQLRSEDANKAQPNQVVVNYQGHTNTRDAGDNASGKLFSKVDSSLLRKPTYEQYIKMMNNWNRVTGVKEPAVTEAEEKQEVGAFLTSVMNTNLWQTLYKFLVSKGHPFASDPTTFRYWVAQLWFVHYSRARGMPDTSGFEHIFMGETKNGEISGMHNWLRFYLLERNTTEEFDYKGFIVKRFNVMAAVKFTWKGELKRSGSFLIGTSPEFDLALYTLCFLSRRGRQTCDIEIDGCPLQITSYDLVQNNKAERVKPKYRKGLGVYRKCLPKCRKDNRPVPETEREVIQRGRDRKRRQSCNEVSLEMCQIPVTFKADHFERKKKNSFK